jgi:hypothetical protein
MYARHLQAITHGLVLVAAMLALVAAALLLRPVSLTTEAHAQYRATKAPGDEGIPDSGRQRQIMIEQLDTLNRRLGDIERGLRDGAYVVQVAEPPDGKKAAAKKEAP